MIYRITLFSALILCIVSCAKLDEILTFRITNRSAFTIPPQTGINLPLVFNTPDVRTSSEQAFRNNNTRADLVKDVILESLSLEIIRPQNQTFQVLREIEIFISADGLPTVLVAFNRNIPQDVGNTLSLETTGAKLDEYIKKDRYSIRTEVVTRQFFSQEVEINSTMVYRVTADVAR